MIRVKAFNHALGECGITFFAAPPLAKQYAKRFPESLNNAPMLFPIEGSSLRRGLDQWFETRDIRPAIAGEFKDSALLKTFGQAGIGVFPAPTVIEKEVKEHYKVQIIGRTTDVIEQFYAISIERKLKHPAVLAITEAARERLFA